MKIWRKIKMKTAYLSTGVLLTITLTVGLMVSSAAMAYQAGANQTQMGRYLTVDNKPLVAQQDLLAQTIQTHFPQDVQTVGQAMAYLLRYSGYRLVDQSKMADSTHSMLNLQLPLVDREMGPMTLKAALETLAGSSFRLVKDPVHRMISFQLKPKYRYLYEHKQTAQLHNSDKVLQKALHKAVLAAQHSKSFSNSHENHELNTELSTKQQ